MPLLQSPFHSVGARGSMGGLTFSNGIGGAQGKAKAKPARRIRTTQPRNRSILGYTSRQWGALSDAQRANWRVYALNNPGINRFGDEFIMSGSNAFSRLNIPAIRLADDTALNQDPPITDPPAAIDTLTVITGVTLPGDIDVSWTELGTGDVADHYELQLAGPFNSPGRESVDSRFAYSAQVAGNVLLDTISGLVEGAYYHVRVRYVGADGQITNWHQGKATPMPTP